MRHGIVSFMIQLVEITENQSQIYIIKLSIILKYVMWFLFKFEVWFLCEFGMLFLLGKQSKRKMSQKYGKSPKGGGASTLKIVKSTIQVSQSVSQSA